MASRLLLSPHGEPARAALWSAIGAAQAGDPLAPVTVAVPSTYAGLALRRSLGRRAGLVNVRFGALARVAELLGAPDLAGARRRPLTPPLLTEAVYATLVADPGPLAAVVDHPSTEQALAATFRDLRDAPDGARLGLSARGGRAAAVVALYDAFRARTRDYYDEADLAYAAAEAVRAAPERLADLGHVIVHLPASLSPAEEALVLALARADRVTVVLGLCGDTAVDDAITHRLAARLSPVLGDPERVEGAPPELPADLFGYASSQAPLGTHVLSAPDAEDEVRAVARRIVEHAERGLPLHRIAVLSRLAQPYGRLVPEILDADGIPWNGAAPRRLADTTAGRVLRGLLELAEHDFARDAVAAWLASGPILDPAHHTTVDAARYDVVSRQAGVVGGAAQWVERLVRHAAMVERQLAERGADELPEWRRRGVERDLETVRRLAVFMAELIERVQPPEPASWATLATWANGLVDCYLGGEGRRGAWPEAEFQAGLQVQAALEHLTALDAFDAPVDLARFRRAVVGALDAPAARVGRFGTGVFVGSLRQAYAADFDVVYVLGAVEGGFPPRGREDPLLPDRDRRSVEGLALHRDRRGEERLEYRAARAAAPSRVFCFPRADAPAQRRLLPARWLLETARALHGTELTAEGLRDLSVPSPWLDVVASFGQGVGADNEPASPAEYDLRSLVAWRTLDRSVGRHPLATGALRPGFDTVFARASRALTSHDGFVDARASLAPGDRVVSPTSLEAWSTCPFRYLLGSVLRLRELPRPEETETISALDEGSLVHAILEEFVRDARPRTTPEEPWDTEARALMHAITEAHCADAARRGITGRSVPWQLARRRIFQTVARFLETDELVRAELDVLPDTSGLELAFGIDGAEPVAVPLTDGRTVRFRGRIDRVDRSPDGTRVVVYDYKTGSAKSYEGIGADDPVAGGTKLQLPVYALAAEQHYGGTDAHAYYWFTKRDYETAFIGYPLERCRDEFAETLTTIVDGVGAGCFPAVPGEREWNPWQGRDTYSNCSRCDFDRLCTADREAAWLRKSSDAAAAPFVRLRPEPETGLPGEGEGEAGVGGDAG